MEVNRLYFSILLAQEQRELLVVRGKQLEEKRIEVGSGVQNGMLILSSQQVLDAEIILLKQQLITVEQWEKTMYKSLSLLIGKELELGALVKSSIIYDTNGVQRSTRGEFVCFQKGNSSSSRRNY